MRMTSLPLLGLALALAACNTANDGVRNGPQAVHPSTSPLAAKQYYAPDEQYPLCANDPTRLCRAYEPGDGARPIID